MIIHCDNGAALVLDECHWTEGAYLAVNHFGGAGAVLDYATLEQVHDELGRIRAAIEARTTKQQKRKAA